MGAISTHGDDTGFGSRIRISFMASGETGNGPAFGVSIRADNTAGGAAGTGGSVHVAGAFGTITLGDTAGAARQAVGQGAGAGMTGQDA